MSRAQQPKQYNDLITWDEYCPKTERSVMRHTQSILLRKQELVKRGGSAMTNQQLSDAYRRDPAPVFSDGNKIIDYEEALERAQKGLYYERLKVKWNMQTAAKVAVQRECYSSGCCTMDAVIAHCPDLILERTQDTNGKWGFTVRLHPDAGRNAIHVLKLCQAVKELPDVPVNFKTELCKFHFSKSGCVNGGRCHFAHSKKELRNLAPPSLIQSSPRKPETKAPPTPAPWSRQGNSDASPIRPPPQESAPLAPPAPPAFWFH
jgi:hypothetical protein